MVRYPVLVVLAALVTGCSSTGGGADAPAPNASNSGIVPPSLTASAAAQGQGQGQKLSFGQSAEVSFRPNAKRATTLRLAVTVARTGRVSDLAAYALDDQAKASTPYYVRVDVANDGSGDVGGSPVPLWATTTAGAVVGASSFAQPFAKCRSTPLPQPFARGASLHTCLLFLVPQGATLVALTNRTAAGDVAVTWTGQVEPPRPQKK
ncbi:hypothetical protein D9V37_06420 [Nocardioides mangrovicus]|uniref:DUF4352 domain-containing protein n=1 Tax=Nocardioides mangrovicus TaxID=2478913 RepID=A0A3L8P2D0_9ACTN|nr:hypothetical protein [Nocardioides mangrovicus]RLV49556.1 hypothetical protein D9V37_06420 [Nocardioides mangrovicus]